MMKYCPRADWNVGTFQQTGGNIAEDYAAIVPAISFRPTSQTVIHLNYRRAWQQDLLGNPPSNIRWYSIRNIELFLKTLLLKKGGHFYWKATGQREHARDNGKAGVHAISYHFQWAT